MPQCMHRGTGRRAHREKNRRDDLEDTVVLAGHYLRIVNQEGVLKEVGGGGGQLSLQKRNYRCKIFM